MRTAALEQSELTRYALRVATEAQLEKLSKMLAIGWDVYRIVGQTPHIACNPYVEKNDGVIFVSSRNNPQRKLVSAKLLQSGELVRL